MMAHDESLAPEPRALSAETLERLRDAVWRAWLVPAQRALATVSAHERDSDAELRDAVAVVASEAHGRGLRAEELVVAFKAVIEGLAEREAGPTGPGARAFQSRLVTLCIKAYYGA